MAKIQSVQVESMEEIKELFFPVTSAMNRFRPRLGNVFFKIMEMFQTQTDGEFDDLPDDDSESGLEAKFPSLEWKRKTGGGARVRRFWARHRQPGKFVGSEVKETQGESFSGNSLGSCIAVYADLEEVSQANTEYFRAKWRKSFDLAWEVSTVPNADSEFPLTGFKAFSHVFGEIQSRSKSLEISEDTLRATAVQLAQEEELSIDIFHQNVKKLQVLVAKIKKLTSDPILNGKAL
eukprot:768061-Hanusia_phi.AAC.3